MRLLTHAAFRYRAGFVCGDAAAEQGLQPGLHFARAEVKMHQRTVGVAAACCWRGCAAARAHAARAAVLSAQADVRCARVKNASAACSDRDSAQLGVLFPCELHTAPRPLVCPCAWCAVSSALLASLATAHVAGASVLRRLHLRKTLADRLRAAASLGSVGAFSTMGNAASSAGATARASAPPTPGAEAIVPGSGTAQLQSAGGSLDAAAEFTRALPSLRRVRRARHAADDGGEDADAGATLGDARGAARGGEQALQGAHGSTHAARTMTLELPDAGGGGGGLQKHAVPMPPGAQRFRGVTWNKRKGRWHAQHTAMRMYKRFPADQAAAAAQAYDAAVRIHGGTVVNFPRPGTVETAAKPPRAGGRGRKQGPTPMLPGEQRYKGVRWDKETGRWRTKYVNFRTRKVEHVGYFASDQAAAAARAYDDAVRAAGGSVVNFPLPGTAEMQAQFGEEAHRPGSTSFKGVSKARNKFAAQATLSGRTKYLGLFATAEEAARVRDLYMREQGAPAHKLSFPDEAGGAGAVDGAEAPGGKRKHAALSAPAAASSDADDEDAAEEQHSTPAAPPAADSASPLPDALPASAASGAELASPQARIAALEAHVAALQSSNAARAQLATQLASTQARAAELEAELARMRRDAARSTRSAAAVAAQARQAVAVKLERMEGAEAAAAVATAAATAAEHALEEAHEAAACSICLDAVRDTLAFTCGHVHCAACGAAMARCPLCQSRKRHKALRVYL
jgi:hypothetical protein